MANQERGARRGILGIGAPPKEAPAPVSPKPEKPPTKKPLIQRLVNNLALRIVLAGTALAGTGYAAYQIPAVHRAVDQQVLERLGLKTPEVPSVFDNSKDKGVIGDNNTIPASLQEIQSQFPQQIVAEGSRITFLNPFQLPDGTSVSYVKSLSDRLMTEELQQQAQKDPQIKDHVDFDLPKGTTIVAPVDGYGFIDMGKSEFNEDNTKSTGVFFVHYDKENDTTYKIGLFPLSNNTTTRYFDVQATELALPAGYPIDKLRGDNWQKWPKIAIGQPLVRLPENQQVIMRVEGYRGKIIGPQAALVNKTIFLVTPNFFTVTDNAGVEKLLVLKN